jgi:hypothetical protein
MRLADPRLFLPKAGLSRSKSDFLAKGAESINYVHLKSHAQGHVAQPGQSG